MPAVVQFPNLPASVALNGSEIFALVQSGTSVRSSLDQMALYINDRANISPHTEHFLIATGVPAVDTAAMKRAIDRASAAKALLNLYGNFVLQYPETSDYDFVSQPERPIHIAVLCDTNDVMIDGANATIRFEYPSFTPLPKARLVGFGSPLNLERYSQHNFLFKNFTFDFYTAEGKLPANAVGICMSGIGGFTHFNNKYKTQPLTATAALSTGGGGSMVVTILNHGLTEGQGVNVAWFLSLDDVALPTTITAGYQYYALVIDSNSFHISLTDTGDNILMQGPDITCTAWFTHTVGFGVQLDNCDDVYSMNNSYTFMRQGWFGNVGHNINWLYEWFEQVSEAIDWDDYLDGFSVVGCTAINMFGDAQILDFSPAKNGVVIGNKGIRLRQFGQFYSKQTADGSFPFLNKFKYPFTTNLLAGSPGTVSAPGCKFEENTYAWMEWNGDPPIVGTLPAGVDIFTNYYIRNPNPSLGTCNLSPVLQATSGTYDPVTGTVVLTMSASISFTIGEPLVISGVMGTGDFAQLNGTSYTAIAGTTGTTVKYTAATGLNPTTITNALVVPSTLLDFDINSVTPPGGELQIDPGPPPETISPSINVVIASNTCTGLISENVADKYDLMLSHQRLIGPGTERTNWMNGMPIQCQNFLVYDNSFQGGNGTFVSECLDLGWDGFTSTDCVPTDDASAGFALQFLQSTQGTIATVQSKLTGYVRNVFVTNTAGGAVSVVGPGDGFILDGVNVRGYNLSASDNTRVAVSTGRMEAAKGHKTIANIDVDGGVNGATLACTDINLARGSPAVPLATRITLRGNFDGKSTAAGATNFTSDLGPLVIERTMIVIPSVDTSVATGAATVRVPVFTNGNITAFELAAALVNMDAISGSTTNYTTAQLRLDTAGTRSDVSNVINVDNAATIPACTSNPFTISHPVATGGTVLFIEYKRVANGSVLPAMMFSHLPQFYTGPL